MKCLVWRAVFIALLLPIFAVAAESASSEYASVLKAKPDPVHGAQLFGQCISCHGADGGGDVGGAEAQFRMADAPVTEQDDFNTPPAPTTLAGAAA